MSIARILVNLGGDAINLGLIDRGVASHQFRILQGHGHRPGYSIGVIVDHFADASDAVQNSLPHWLVCDFTNCFLKVFKPEPRVDEHKIVSRLDPPVDGPAGHACTLCHFFD